MSFLQETTMFMDYGRISATNKRINFGSHCWPMSLLSSEKPLILDLLIKQLECLRMNFHGSYFCIDWDKCFFHGAHWHTCCQSFCALKSNTERPRDIHTFVNQLNISSGIHNPVSLSKQQGILPLSSVGDGKLQSCQAILKSEEANYKNHSTHLQMVYSFIDPYLDTCCT